MKKKLLCIVLCLCIICAACPPSILADGVAVPVDVSANAWYYDAVKYAYANSLLPNLSSDAFYPNEGASRGWLSLILYVFAGSPIVTAHCPFVDIDAESIYEKSSTWAYSNGIISDYNSMFRPDDPVTREYFAEILMNYVRWRGQDVSGRAELTRFTDIDATTGAAREAVSWVCSVGLMNGTSETTFSPKSPLTRAQTVVVLMRVFQSGIITLPEQSTAQLDHLDMSKWHYHLEDNVYYQLSIPYCLAPADSTYETLSIFVPGEYLTGTDNGDGTWTCVLNPYSTVGSYTSATAPIVIPVETPGYSAQRPLSEYRSFTEYMKRGFVYVWAGCRGREAGAPAGVTDLKAAIRYLRYTKDTLAGNVERIFVFGMSGGGAQSAILGASGDSPLYYPYLNAIGAIQGVSDAVLGSMDWCPITNLDTADEGYEWMMGVTRTGLSDEERILSDALAESFASYINEARFTDENGNFLTLEKSEAGIFQQGSYYDYLKTVIETSLNHFLSDTDFPYDASASSNPFGIGGGPLMGNPSGGGLPDLPGGADDNIALGNPSGGGLPDLPGGADNNIALGNPSGGGLPDLPGGANDNIARMMTSNDRVKLSGTYETVQDYIDALNAGTEWIRYDKASNTASITSVADFALALKGSTKGIGAFDQLDAGQGENELFGYGDGKGAHFDSRLFEILRNMESPYAASYARDFAKTDAAGYTVNQRLEMYTPLYYLMETQSGYQRSTPAKYWRIRSGISQADTSLTTEVNLALALSAHPNVLSVDFATVWGVKHTKAERTGNSDTNFINWVNNCLEMPVTAPDSVENSLPPQGIPLS